MFIFFFNSKGNQFNTGTRSDFGKFVTMKELLCGKLAILYRFG